jgi:hypothetical protein
MGSLRYLGSFAKELIAFAKAHKAYWIVPLLILLALVVSLVVAGNAAAPFIYTLF